MRSDSAREDELATANPASCTSRIESRAQTQPTTSLTTDSRNLVRSLDGPAQGRDKMLPPQTPFAKSEAEKVLTQV